MFGSRTVAFWLLNTLFVVLILSPGQSHGAGFCQEKLLFGPLPVHSKTLTERRPGYYKFEDKTYNFKFEANLSEDGELLVEAYLVNPRRNLRAQKSGKELYQEMVEHIGLDNIPIIKGLWYGGTNLIQFTDGLSAGLVPTEAARATWSGRMAAKYGFSEVKNIEIEEENRQAGKVIVGVQLDFVRPEGQKTIPKPPAALAPSLNSFKPVQGDTLVDTSNPDIYSFVDLDFGFYFKAELDNDGAVIIAAKMSDPTKKIRSAETLGRQYQSMIQYFGSENIKATRFTSSK